MAKVGRMVKDGSIQEIAAQLSERPNFFITAINRLSAPDADTLRRQLFGSKAHLLVVKRRLGQRAVSGLNVAGLSELLEGSVGIVLVETDVPAAAKRLVEFRKTHEAGLAVRGAVVDGQLLDASWVERLAQLPPKPVLLAQVVATIEAPIADVIFTVERLIGDIAWLAEQVASQKPLPAPPPNVGGARAGSELAPDAPAAASPSPEPSGPSAQEPNAPKQPEEGTSP
jgi:large subunit ribosomal protein L10